PHASAGFACLVSVLAGDGAAACARSIPAAEADGRVRADLAAARAGSIARCAAAGDRVRLCVGGLLRVCRVGGSSPHEGAARGRTARIRYRQTDLMPTAAHFIYIPSVLLIGIVIGWILGSRAAADAYASELRKREANPKSQIPKPKSQ